MKYLNGHYTVNGEIIENKIYAMLKASETNSDVIWHYWDNIYTDAVLKYKYKETLEELYRQRAQQLRDSYDYLILNYSGGADSHNILNVFLKFNIKLDLIYVQWPEQLMNKGLYTPNSIDKSNSNFHSEWDLVIKKDLQWISKIRPNIIIDIGDWSATVKESFYHDDLFLNNVTNLPSIARAQKQNTFSKYESEWTSKGKTVGSIFGVDKTNIVKKENQWYFYFVDTAFMTQPNIDNPNGIEYFYHTPLFPEITITQAKLLIDWYSSNPGKQYLIQAKSERVKKDHTYINWDWSDYYDEISEIAEIYKYVCYPYWDFNRFQADKPYAILDGFKPGIRAWDNILTAVPDFDRVQQKWEYNWRSYYNKINKKFMLKHSKDTVAPIKSVWHIINIE